MSVTVALAVATVAFVFVCGANDGGTLLALATRHLSGPRWGVLAALAGAILVGPALFGTTVAHTFTDRLVTGTGERARLIFLAGATSAVLLVLALTWRGIPTSITLAVLGSLAGAGTGLGTRPAWGALGVVLVIGAAAPLVGGLAGFLLGRAARRIPSLADMPRLVRASQHVAFGAQCLAYAANDGQKMFAVVAVAGLSGSTVHPTLGALLLVAGVFAVGAAVSLRRVGRGATTALLAARPWQVTSAEVASCAAVLGSAGLGAPVSMTQSVTGGLIGAGASQGSRRVRWQYAVPLMTAWLVTLPAGFAVGLLTGLLLREMVQ